MKCRDHISLVVSMAILLGATHPMCAGQTIPSAQTEQQPSATVEKSAVPTAAEPVAAIGDAERSALTFSSYDLSVHLRPEDASISVLARVIVRNDGDTALPQIALQISSSLRWDGVSQRIGSRTAKLSLNQHRLETDADHTSNATEAVIHLAEPLAAHASTELVLLYSGSIVSSTARLDRAGATTLAAGVNDWDLISSDGTGLRGFGNVLWYPTASPQVFLGDGDSLLHAAGQQMLRQSAASVRLRISVEYMGDAPGAVFFCGRQEPLTPTSDNSAAPVADAPGIATAEFSTQQLGFRTLSLFVTDRPVPAGKGALAIASSDASVAERLSTSSAPILAMLAEWFGGDPARTLTIIDHPGHPFEDGDLLVAPVSGADGLALTLTLVPALTHTRFRSSQVWLDQGITQLMSLLWIERTQGRSAAIGVMDESFHSLALAESVTRSETAGIKSLLGAGDAVYYRTKAGVVLWMLRDMVGDDVFKQVLSRYSGDPRLDHDTQGFERLLEEVSGKDLRWFFDDWVYHDPGLPDLAIVSVAPRELSSTSRQGTGWLVVVEVRNDGAASVEVPVTVRSGTLNATERVRVNAHSVASTRIVFQGLPEQVQVNDGTVPELVTSTHIQVVAVH